MNESKNVYDLTATLSSKTVAYPGDPQFQTKKILSLNEGHPFCMCSMSMGNHCGTHIDFPSHVIEGAKSSSDFQLSHFIGNGIIVQVPEEYQSVTKQFIEQLCILPNDIVLFSTANKKINKQDQFQQKYVYIESKAAAELVKKQIKIVGIDYLSVDKYDDDNLSTHHQFLKHDVLIIQGLCMQKAPKGRVKVYIIPLKIDNMDGLPVRVFCQKLNQSQ